jgi:hypothetical protein
MQNVPASNTVWYKIVGGKSEMAFGSDKIFTPPRYISGRRYDASMFPQLRTNIHHRPKLGATNHPIAGGKVCTGKAKNRQRRGWRGEGQLNDANISGTCSGIAGYFKTT